MQENQIAIIAQCGSDGVSAMRAYAGALLVPEGYEAELIEIAHEENVAAAYQRAMESCEAKYKVYLRANTVILKADFLLEMLRVFQSDEKIALIGVVGTDQLSTSGLLAQSPRVFGRLLYWDGSRFTGDISEGDVQDVMAATGDLIATQHDVPWRGDLFHADCFWAEAQCAEFCRRGLRCVVPRQDEEWVLAERASTPFDEGSRNAFLDAYSPALYPLVSIILPTCGRPAYFREALKSVLAQTYRNLDIFITDDSRDEETEQLVRREFARDPRIRYEHHRDYGLYENWERGQLHDHPKAEFVNWLMDDDRFLPNKIETMVEYFLAHPDVSLVTSYRPCMDERGERLPDLPYTKPLFDRVTKLDGRSAGNLILTENVNVIGESTTPLIRKALLLEGHRLGWTGREGKYLVSDFPTWLRLLASGSLIYIPEALSEFRQHGGQAQAHADVAFICQIGWAMAIREAIESKSFLLKDAEKKAAILIWLANTATAMGLYQDDAEWAQQRGRDLRTVFSAMAAALENGYRIQFDIDTTLHLNMQGESK